MDISLPNKGTEDVSFLLNVSNEDTPIKQVGNLIVREPNEDFYWLVDVEFNDFTMSDEDIIRLLSGYIVYGHAKDLNVWVSVGRKEGPCIYDKISICIDVYDNVDNEVCVTYEELENYIGKIEKKFKTIGDVKIIPRGSIEMAINKGNKLSEFFQEEEMFEHNIVLKLVSDEGRLYEGKDIWDVMLCLGIEWGDMDIFHAENKSQFGDDYLFSISTTTDPGFFWLHTIAEDTFDDLVFVMDIARTSNTLESFNAMWRVAEYIKKRLGGSLLDEMDMETSKDNYIEVINDTICRFKKWGFKPGEDVALFLF